jgi:hypothetical protein
VLELLLLTWPDTSQQDCVITMQNWGWVLLLVALLQQAPGEVRRQLVQQRGSQLMQLLYYVLLEEVELGGKGINEGSDGLFINHVHHKAAISRGAVEAVESGAQQEFRSKPAQECWGELDVHMLVLQVLQSLLLEAPSGPALFTALKQGSCTTVFGDVGEQGGW